MCPIVCKILINAQAFEFSLNQFSFLSLTKSFKIKLDLRQNNLQKNLNSKIYFCFRRLTERTHKKVIKP